MLTQGTPTPTSMWMAAATMRIFSPVSLAAFMAVFGATGLIATIGFGTDARLSLLIAGLVAAGASLGVAFAYGLRNHWWHCMAAPTCARQT
ncbi:MAG: hypothetical protein R2844_19860 [Caldilineales bacterium]